GCPLYMFDYDVFGQPLQDRPERFRHGFTGKEFDSWTGLYDYGFRDYASLYGRFTSVDPIQDGHNCYAYVNSDPVSWLDPWGLCPTDTESGEDPARNAEATEKAPSHWGITVTEHGQSLLKVRHFGMYGGRIPMLDRSNRRASQAYLCWRYIWKENRKYSCDNR
ncbi:MAG: RHS repeat-associated core domain-containing protein, partial [Treponema sp.]|nr:RHS repeat-associated core domain-containing protein [Treponema sp.]